MINIKLPLRRRKHVRRIQTPTILKVRSKKKHQTKRTAAEMSK